MSLDLVLARDPSLTLRAGFSDVPPVFRLHMSTESTATFPFRCVCGQTIQVDAQDGGSCDECGREYSGQAVSVSMTMTVDMPGCGAAAAVDDDDEMIGEAIDHFTIVEKLGNGGMGTVYRAIDESLQRYVALKLIRRGEGGANETVHVERLLQEARAQARVNHANVVHIYFVSRSKESPYLAMELVPGPTLEDRLNEGALPYRDVVNIGLQIAQALRVSTRYDIVHGDIKPSNILLHEDSAKLSDFGLAQRISEQDEGSGRIAGTPNYMAPEVCRGEPATAQSDMYSFGVMLFEMTFGRQPYSYSDTTIHARLEAHQNQTPEFPASWPEEVPESWQPFLDRLLAKEPADRFASWDELIADMQALRPVKPVAAGRIQRGISWLVDILLLLSAQVLVSTVFRFVKQAVFPTSTLFDLLVTVSVIIPPILMGLWISRGWTTLGKAIMKLRIVDRHGLPMRARVLAQRSVLQFLPIWMLPTGHQTETHGLPNYIQLPLWLTIAGFVIVEIVLVLFRRGGRSLHDQIFRTQVVLQESQRDA